MVEILPKLNAQQMLTLHFTLFFTYLTLQLQEQESTRFPSTQPASPLIRLQQTSEDHRRQHAESGQWYAKEPKLNNLDSQSFYTYLLTIFQAAPVWEFVSPALRHIFGDNGVSNPRDEEGEEDEPDTFEDAREEPCNCDVCASRLDQIQPEEKDLNSTSTEEDDHDDTREEENGQGTEDNVNELDGNQKQLDVEKDMDSEGKSKELCVERDGLEERERALDSKSKELHAEQEEMEERERERALDSKSKERRVKQEELDEKERDLGSKSKELRVKQGELDEKERDLGDKSKELLARRRELDEKEREVNVKSKVLHMKQQELDEKTRELDKKEEGLKEMENNLIYKERSLEQDERGLEGKQKDLEAKEVELDGRQKDLDAKESELEGKEKDMDAREVEFQTKERQLDEKEQRLNELGETLALAREELETLKNAVWSLERKGAEKEEELKRRLNALGLEWVLVA